METVDAFTPAKSVAFGAALSAANPKNLALTIAAAGAELGASWSWSRSFPPVA